MHPGWRLVETDNFGRDYPCEKWASPYTFMAARDASKVAEALNTALNIGYNSPRYIKVVELPYTLDDKPFEP